MPTIANKKMVVTITPVTDASLNVTAQHVSAYFAFLANDTLLANAHPSAAEDIRTTYNLKEVHAIDIFKQYKALCRVTKRPMSTPARTVHDSLVDYSHINSLGKYKNLAQAGLSAKLRFIDEGGAGCFIKDERRNAIVESYINIGVDLELDAQVSSSFQVKNKGPQKEPTSSDSNNSLSGAPTSATIRMYISVNSSPFMYRYIHGRVAVGRYVFPNSGSDGVVATDNSRQRRLISLDLQSVFIDVVKKDLPCVTVRPQLDIYLSYNIQLYDMIV